MLNTKFTVAALLSLTILTACTSPVDHQDSGIATPSAWSRLAGAADNAPLATDENAKVEHEWWKHFNDPVLNQLTAEALENNKTLAIAKARVEEARAGRMAARSTLLPQIDGVADASRGNQGLLTNDKVYSIADADVEASWELDLFGKNQARMAQANAILQSQEASQKAVMVELLAEVARNYFDLRNYERQVVLIQQNLDSQRKTLELTKAQFEGALASNFDVERAAAQVSTTESQLPTAKIAYDTTLNRLNVLLGHAPGEKDALLKTPAELQPLDTKIIVTAPATVLATRPDVAVAERQFAASISASDAATRELFPTISLLGLFGAQSSTPFSSSPWSVGGNLTLPILNFGKIEAQIDAADAEQKQAFMNYQEVVLEALENMENSLTNYLNETDRNASLANAVEQNRKAVDLAKQQYTNGYNGLLDVLVIERYALEAESAQASSDAKLRKDLVNIYTAAGGGWDAKVEAEEKKN